MNTKNKSNLLLIELILAILFFSVTVSICVRVIFSAHEMSRQNSVLTKAAITADSIVSIWKEDKIETAELAMGKSFKAVKEEKGWSIYFDREFNNVGKENSRYVMTVQTDEELYLRKILIHLIDLEKEENEENSVVYSLSTENFIQGGKEQ